MRLCLILQPLYMETGEIKNKVALSGLITFNLADYYTPGERTGLDIQPWLFMGLILKEKEFREQVKAHDWEQYKGKCVYVYCSADAIVPVWAYMLIATRLQACTEAFVFGNADTLETVLFNRKLSTVDFSEFSGKRMIVKGCSDVKVPESIYVELTRLLLPYAEKIMFGEACSNVPLYKKEYK